ncbi:MAG TPA: helix-turn-helix domain-containing protein [Thauera sp.]|uniref:helix-turn-helix domain-containing protein n=1 Tax=Thauera sp. TaxID=1905334 RepID=UPI002C884D18|nr:helix-turn-helix domain-containing protein [Thauera sp.]HRP23070.1 helix-turn-helix domain-containing protein [Thauera sp.]HRP64443.1 helix-turn-helix domain-containing protein [Thauera sp.]
MQSENLAPPASADISSSPGSRLRREREARGQSVHEVAFALKLSPRQIEALERDDFAALPGMAFVRGFMRNYARYLGLDATPLLDGVQRMAGVGSPDLSPIRNADGDLPSGGSPRRGSFPSGLVVVVLLVLVAAGWYFDWFQTEPGSSASSQNVELAPSFAPAPMQPIEPPSPLSAPVVPAPIGQPAAPAGDAGVATESAAAAAAAGPEAPAAAAEATAGTPAPTAAATADEGGAVAAAEAAPAPAAAPSTEQPAPLAGNQLSFRFAADSWVEVRDGAGSILHSGTNRAGSSRTVQGTPPFALVVGNAASVTLEFNGQPVDLAAHIRGSVARLTLR